MPPFPQSVIHIVQHLVLWVIGKLVIDPWLWELVIITQNHWVVEVIEDVHDTATVPVISDTSTIVDVACCVLQHLYMYKERRQWDFMPLTGNSLLSIQWCKLSYSRSICTCNNPSWLFLRVMPKVPKCLKGANNSWVCICMYTWTCYNTTAVLLHYTSLKYPVKCVHMNTPWRGCQSILQGTFLADWCKFSNHHQWTRMEYWTPKHQTFSAPKLLHETGRERTAGTWKSRPIVSCNNANNKSDTVNTQSMHKLTMNSEK